MYPQEHLGVDMAADRKSPGARKLDLDRLAGRLLVRIEGHARRVDIDLVEKLVLVGKEQRVAARDCYLAHSKSASFLDDSVDGSRSDKLRESHQHQKH